MDKFKGGMGVKKDYGWAGSVMNPGAFIDFNDMLSGNYMQKMKLFAPKSAGIEPGGNVGNTGDTGGIGNTASAAGGGVGGVQNFGGGSNVQPVAGMVARQRQQLTGESEERVEANRGTVYKQYDGSKFEPNTVQGNVGTGGAGIGGVNERAAKMAAGAGGARVGSAGTGAAGVAAYDPVKLIDKIELDSAIDERREKEVLGRFDDSGQGQWILNKAKALTGRPTLTAAEKARISSQGEGAVPEVQAAAAERQRLEFEQNVQNSTNLYELKEVFDKTFPGIKRVKDLTKSGIRDFAERWAEQNKLSGEETEFLREELPKLIAQDYPETFVQREEGDLQAGNKQMDVFASDYRAEDAAVERVITEVLGEQGIEFDEGSRREVFLRVRDKLDNAATAQERLVAAKELVIGEARFVRIRREAEAKLRGDIAAAVDPYAYYDKFKAGSFLEEFAGSEKLGAAAKEELGEILADRAYDLASEEGRGRTASVPDFTVQKMDRVVSKAGLSEEEEEGYLAGFEDEEQGQEILKLARSRTGFIELTAEEKRILLEQGEEAALTAVRARYREELKKNMRYYTDYFRMEEAFDEAFPDIKRVKDLTNSQIRNLANEWAEYNDVDKDEKEFLVEQLIKHVGQDYTLTADIRENQELNLKNGHNRIFSNEFIDKIGKEYYELTDELQRDFVAEMVSLGSAEVSRDLKSVKRVVDKYADILIDSMEGSELLTEEEREFLRERFFEESGLKKRIERWRDPRYAGGLEETVRAADCGYDEEFLNYIYKKYPNKFGVVFNKDEVLNSPEYYVEMVKLENVKIGIEEADIERRLDELGVPEVLRGKYRAFMLERIEARKNELIIGKIVDIELDRMRKNSEILKNNAGYLGVEQLLIKSPFGDKYANYYTNPFKELKSDISGNSDYQAGTRIAMGQLIADEAFYNEMIERGDEEGFLLYGCRAISLTYDRANGALGRELGNIFTINEAGNNLLRLELSMMGVHPDDIADYINAKRGIDYMLGLIVGIGVGAGTSALYGKSMAEWIPRSGRFISAVAGGINELAVPLTRRKIIDNMITGRVVDAIKPMDEEEQLRETGISSSIYEKYGVKGD